ncbi:MAG: Ig-like domain-containing protein [Spirochaetales bacterium]|nr:Ig-like domain-containing protein [Spirochaetales bacterium]
MNKIKLYTLIALASISTILGCKDPLSVITDNGLNISAGDIVIKTGEASGLEINIDEIDSLEGEITWSSSDETIATVSQDGTVTGVAPGIAEIKATYTDNVLCASWKIKVNPTHLIMFATERVLPDFGSRKNVDGLVTKGAPTGLYNIHALISFDKKDCIKNMVKNYNYPSDIPIFAQAKDDSGKTVLYKVADNWGDFIDGLNINLQEVSVPVIPYGPGGTFWSGSDAFGRVSNATGKSWTSNTDEEKATIGSLYGFEKAWLNETEQRCSAKNSLLGLGISKDLYPNYSEVTGFALDKTEIVLTKDNMSTVLNVNFTPSNATIKEVRWKAGITGLGVTDWCQLSDARVSQYIKCTVNDSSLIIESANNRTTNIPIIIRAISAEGEIVAEATVEVKNIKSIIMFISSQTYLSNFAKDKPDTISTRDFIDNMLRNDPNMPEGYNNVRAFLSITEEDCIANMKSNFNIPTDLKVTVRTGHVIADSFTNFTASKLRTSYSSVANDAEETENFWSASYSSGTLNSYNASEWTVYNDETYVAYGLLWTTDPYNFIVTNTTNKSKCYIVGVAW